MITVALIDDNRLMREGLARLLYDLAELAVVAVMPTAEIARLQQLRPQVVLLTLGAQHVAPLHVAADLRGRCPGAGLILMHLPDAPQRIALYVAAGVSAFVSRDATLDRLAETIQAVAAGTPIVLQDDPAGRYDPTAVLAQLDRRGRAVAGRAETTAAVRMTPRERDVVALIADGMSNQQIAAHLAIASDTVKSHVRNVMKKLMVHTRLQIAAYAHRDERVDD